MDSRLKQIIIIKKKKRSDEQRELQSDPDGTEVIGAIELDDLNSMPTMRPMIELITFIIQRFQKEWSKKKTIDVRIIHIFIFKQVNGDGFLFRFSGQTPA